MISPLEAVEQLAAWGFCVLPCAYQKKAPAIAWKGYQDPEVVPTAEDRQKWFGGLALSNYWLLQGRPSRSVVCDCDNKETIAWLYEQVGASVLDSTPQVRTAKGRHFYFRIGPDEVVDSWSEHNGEVELDFRAEGSGVVAPPSIHQSGMVYTWLRTPNDGWQPLPDTLRRPFAGALSDEAAPTTRETLASLLAHPAQQGGRNQWLTSVCGHLAKQHAFKDGYLANVGVINRTLQPPLPPGEVEKTALSVWELEHRHSAVPVELTESAVAHLLASCTVGKFWYVPNRGWLVYNEQEGRYRDDDDAALAIVQGYVESMRLMAIQGGDKKAITFVNSLASARGLKALLSLAQIEPGLRAKDEEFDNRHDLLNLPNGVLDLTKGELLPHSPEYRFTRLTRSSWEPDSDCPLWRKHLERIMDGDRELISFIQRWLGRSLSGLSPSDNCRILMPYGTGANGKTVTVETVSMLLGDYAVTTDFTTWCASKEGNGGAQRHDLVALEGARLVTATESGYHHTLDEAQLKAYTGGEHVSPRGMYAKKATTFRPHFSLMLSTNHLPKLEGSDRGFWRRFLKIGFEVEIPDPDQDQRMQAKLAGEMAGILAWMYRGYVQWSQIGLDPPTSVLLETAQYRSDIDWVGQFANENIIAVEGSETELIDVYSRYEMWCIQCGIKRPMTAQQLSARLAEKGFKRNVSKTTRRSVFVNMALDQMQVASGRTGAAAWMD